LRDGATGGNYVKINMRSESVIAMDNGLINFVPANLHPSGLATLTLINDRLTYVQIVHDWYSNTQNVEEQEMFETSIYATPSPVYANSSDIDIVFNLIKDGNITIDIYDVLGNNIITLADTYFNAGTHKLNFDLRDNKGFKLNSGAYQIRLNAGLETKTTSLIVIQ